MKALELMSGPLYGAIPVVVQDPDYAAPEHGAITP
jgi:hypothetical protein